MRPTVFLSAASVDLREWRDTLHGAFSRGGFRVLTQDESLPAAPGNVRDLLVRAIDQCDWVVHLAGQGYGSDATDAFPEAPEFQCSWTQFEYYYAHSRKMGVIGLVCAPELSKKDFEEKSTGPEDLERRRRLQTAHRERVSKGTFEGTPLPNTPSDRTSNETIKSVGELLKAVAAAVGTLHQADRSAQAREDANWTRVFSELSAIAQARRVATPPFQLPPAASQYFGRGAAVADLILRLSRRARTDVTGGAGIGKTALAAEAVKAVVGSDVAALASGPYPDGVVFLDLYRLKQHDVAWNALADAFDESIPTDMKAEERARRGCLRRQALIILEGAEEFGERLEAFLAPVAAESTILVLTRDEHQSAANRRIRLSEQLEPADALDLLRHLTREASPRVPDSILEGVQRRLGGHPLALTWAGCQLADGDQPAARFRKDLEAQPFTCLTEPGGKTDHTLRWMFERSVRALPERTRLVLAAMARLSEPFDDSWAGAAGGDSADLRRLVQLGLLRVSADSSGWQFAHALAAQFARELALPEPILVDLGELAIKAITTADARCGSDGLEPLALAVGHACALLAGDREMRVLQAVVSALIYHEEYDAVGVRRGRLDVTSRALAAARGWFSPGDADAGSQHLREREYSAVLDRLGDLAVDLGDLAAARDAFTECNRIAERLAASDPHNTQWQRDLSVSLGRLGDLSIAQGDLAAAHDAYAEGKRIRERLVASDPHNAQWQRDLSVSLTKLGDLAVIQGNLTAARDAYHEGKSIRECLTASDQRNAGWQRDLSISLTKLGQVAFAQGDIAAAREAYTEGKRIAESLAASDPQNARWQRDLSMSHGKLGDLAVAQGDLAAAREAYTESKRIAERLAASDPHNAVWQHDLAVMLSKLVDLAVGQGDLAGAREAYTEGNRILKRLAASDPHNARWRRDLAVSHNKLGDLAVVRGDRVVARNAYTESRRIRERLAASDPDNGEWQRDLFLSLYKLADLSFREEAWSDALALMERALAISERLATLDPTNVTWREDVAFSRDFVQRIRSHLGQ